MKSIETEGRTVDQAIELALYKLGVKRDEVRITVLREASIFDKAKVRVAVDSISEEEEKVKNLVEKIIELMGLKLDVFVEEREEDFFVNIMGDDSALFIGKRGESIEEFQIVVNAIYNKDKPRDEMKRIKVDSNSYIVKREETLINLAKRTASKVIREHKPFKFEPMNAFERRIIHSALSENSKVVTESFGSEPNRYVTVKLRTSQPKQPVAQEKNFDDDFEDSDETDVDYANDDSQNED